jgi:hypothetical protein
VLALAVKMAEKEVEKKKEMLKTPQSEVVDLDEECTIVSAKSESRSPARTRASAPLHMIK